MNTVVGIDCQEISNSLQDPSIHDQKSDCANEINQTAIENHHGVCAICLNKIVLQDMALVKGCEHAYCVICILRWATYKKEPTCPQCKHPFEFLNVHRTLDGSIQDYMFEESVCLLLRATWFNPPNTDSHYELEDEPEDFYYPYEEEEEDLDEGYMGGLSSLRIGNRRWGDNGYVRAGRQEARPIYRPNPQQHPGAGSSREPKKKEVARDAGPMGRRAKRTLKREAADKAAAAKHQQHLARLGRVTPDDYPTAPENYPCK